MLAGPTVSQLFEPREPIASIANGECDGWWMDGSWDGAVKVLIGKDELWFSFAVCIALPRIFAGR